MCGMRHNAALACFQMTVVKRESKGFPLLNALCAAHKREGSICDATLFIDV